MGEKPVSAALCTLPSAVCRLQLSAVCRPGVAPSPVARHRT